MVKLILAGILALVLWQGPEEISMQADSDPKAKEILDKTSAIFKELKSVKANLKIIMEIPEQKTFEQKAVVYIKGHSYRLELEDEIIICDNKSVWRYLEEINEVQISDYEPADDEITPTNIFNIYENDFYYQYSQRGMVGDKEFHIIDLTPMNKDKSYFKVKVWVSVEDYLIHTMKVFDKNGSRYTYELSSLIKNGDIKDSMFVFNKALYPGVFIEDLRF